MDILGPLPETEKGNNYILVIGDYFTKWKEAFMEAMTVARHLVSEFMCQFSVPEQFYSDQGRNFESWVIKGIFELLQVRKTRTTPSNSLKRSFHWIKLHWSAMFWNGCLSGAASWATNTPLNNILLLPHLIETTTDFVKCLLLPTNEQCNPSYTAGTRLDGSTSCNVLFKPLPFVLHDQIVAL